MIYMDEKIKGDLAGVKPQTVNELEKLAKFLNKDIIVTSAYRAGDKGEHGKGLAVDIVVPGMALFDLFLAAERFNFTGIGVYPAWQANGKQVGGLHLDTRIGPPARWMGLGSGKTQTYMGLTKENLVKYGVI